MSEEPEVETVPTEKTESDQDGDSVVSESELSIEWPCSTVLHAKGVLNEALLDIFAKYFTKNESRIWQPSMTNDGNESDVDVDDVVDQQFRHCDIAKDTTTLKRLYSMLDSSVEDVVEAFVQKYNFFSLISTKDDYILLRFKDSDFYAEHCECTGLDDDDTGAARRLCIVAFLTDAPEEGGEFEFMYQEVSIKANRGDVLVFPACPLHPNRTTMVKNGELIYAVNYIM